MRRRSGQTTGRRVSASNPLSESRSPLGAEPRFIRDSVLQLPLVKALEVRTCSLREHARRKSGEACEPDNNLNSEPAVSNGCPKAERRPALRGRHTPEPTFACSNENIQATVQRSSASKRREHTRVSSRCE